MRDNNKLLSQTTNSADLIDTIREALDLHYDYPADSQDPDRHCPVTHEAYKALDMIHLELKHAREAMDDMRTQWKKQ
jgi:hypothetical protein